MTDRPILFSAPMVRALRDGRKTQTRRVLKPQPPEAPASAWQAAPGNTVRHGEPYLDAYCGERRTPENPRGMSRNWHWWSVDDRPGLAVAKTPCAPGDRLWVREAWQSNGMNWGKRPRDMRLGGGPIHYAASDKGEWQTYWGGWKPSIHMPRWASRLTLIVTDVRVQRLQDITAEDCTAEGIPFETDALAPYEWSVSRFADLWNSLHGLDAWDENPWVAAITFNVHQCNIDHMPGRDG